MVRPGRSSTLYGRDKQGQQARRENSDNIEKKKSIEGGPGFAISHPTSSSLDADPSPDDSIRSDAYENGINYEFKKADSCGNPEIGVLPGIFETI
jgi:hypothetical protein